MDADDCYAKRNRNAAEPGHGFSVVEAMTPHALLVPRTCNTSDRRTIRWWECELVDTDGSRHIRDQAFFSIGEAKSWASAQGYPVNEDAASSPDT